MKKEIFLSREEGGVLAEDLKETPNALFQEEQRKRTAERVARIQEAVDNCEEWGSGELGRSEEHVTRVSPEEEVNIRQALSEWSESDA